MPGRVYNIANEDYALQLGRGEENLNGKSYNWPSSGVSYKFTGTETAVYVTESTGTVYFNVTVDGGKADRIILSKGWNTVASGLTEEEHTICLERSSEAQKGLIYMSYISTDGSAPEAMAAADRKIEFYGDSYTVGYGNIPTGIAGEGYSAKNTDHYQSYAAITARNFGADSNVIAYSSKGVYLNYISTTATTVSQSNTLPQQFPLADVKIAGETHEQWNFDNYTPQVVVVFLGTNDYLGTNEVTHPGVGRGAVPEEFKLAYINFLESIREKYPDATVICCSKPENCYKDEVTAAVEDVGGETNGYYRLIFETYPETPEGIDYHPTAAQHAVMAQELIDKINSIDGIWN